MTDYQEALDFIWGLVNFETKPPEEREPYTLERMRSLMQRLGDPQKTLRVVHVAGTKGKGSTSAMIERVLRAAGYRVGLYTSPHLHDPRERIRLNGDLIPEAEFTALVVRLRPSIEGLGDVTTFEALTAMAFLWFAESELDITVLEVGLGGRLDATNLVMPLVSVITPLGLEHTQVLGETIEEIAAEKGGIIKPGTPVVVASQPPTALEVLQEIAAERGAPIEAIGAHWEAQRSAISLDGQEFSLWKDGQLRYHDLRIPLLGAHQIANATVVAAALHAVREQGVGWDEDDLREGLAQVEWPARVEVLERSPLVIADGAHTPESASALVQALRDAQPEGWQHATLVLGISVDKVLGPILHALEPLADRVILTRAKHPRAADPVDLSDDSILRGKEVQVIRDVEEAVKTAVAEAGSQDLVVATGSLFVAAEARAAIRQHRKDRSAGQA